MFYDQIRFRGQIRLLVLSLLLMFGSWSLATEGAPFATETFANDQMVVVIEPGTSGGYAGTIQFNGKSYPLIAHEQEGKLAGAFTDADGNSFDFAAALDGTTLSLTTANATYRLSLRQSPAGNTATVNSKLPWLRPGTVVTWTWFGMQHAGTERDYREDAQGNLINPTTGQRFNASDKMGTSAGGYSQVAVAAVDGDTIAFSRGGFTDMRLFGIRDPSPLSDTVADVASLAKGHLGDGWMDPAKLAAMQSVPAEGIEVARVPWKAGDQMVDAVHIDILTSKSLSDYAYDRARGLLLHYFISSQGPPPRYIGPGEAGRGDSYVFRGDFVSVRDAAVPWSQEPLPDWLRQMKSLHYQGSTVFIVKSVMPLPQRPTPLTSDLDVIARGAGWMELVDTIAAQGSQLPPKKKLVICSSSTVGSIWAGPHALAGLTRGQVIDEDPITHVRTVVDQLNDDTVVISVGNAGGTFSAEYDRHTGLRVGLKWTSAIPHAEGSLRLQSRE